MRKFKGKSNGITPERIGEQKEITMKRNKEFEDYNERREINLVVVP